MTADLLADGLVLDEDTEALIRARVPAADLVLTPLAGRGGLLVKTVGEYQVQVVLRMFNWRVQWCAVSDPLLALRFWCYTGLSGAVLTAAILAAAVWDGAADSEPLGWGKNGQTREYGPSVESFLRHAQ